MPATGALDRHAGVHQRQRGAAHRGHRRRAVGLEDVRHDADRVREVLLRRDHRDERPLGERAVADVAALRAAHEAGLPDRERREVVVVEVALGRSPARACRAASPRAWCRARRRDSACVWPRVNSAEPCVRGSRPTSIEIGADLVGAAAVRALLLDRDPLADDRLLELVERALGVARGTRRTSSASGRRSTARASPPRRPWSRPGARACPRPRSPRRALRRASP